jgi:hypothetical protein
VWNEPFDAWNTAFLAGNPAEPCRSSADNRKENQNMARFPEREADIKALAQNIISGLIDNPDFPNPPFTPAQLQTLLDTYINLGDTQVADQAKAQQSTEAKQHGQEEMTSAFKSVLRYAENAVDSNNAKLAALGWSGPAARTPLQVPGQPRSLEAPRQGAGWIFLDWKAPVDGGRPASYRIERRKLPGGDWETVGMAIETEATLNNQERGEEWEYRVIAANKAGEGEPSNAVMAVL